MPALYSDDLRPCAPYLQSPGLPRTEIRPRATLITKDFSCGFANCLLSGIVLGANAFVRLMALIIS